MNELCPPDFARSYPRILAKILWGRGFRDEKAVEAFLNPSLSQIPNPIGQMLDIDEALRILVRARDQHSRVVVFGDYDVDGATSTSLLVRVLDAWGFDVGYYVPHRVQEGYGITAKAAQSLLLKEPKVQVVVTCDCGVGSFEGIEILRARGVEVIVTDHHEVPETRVNAHAVLNPKQKQCQYPDKKLAGVGVAFVLLIALRRALDLKEFSLAPYLDLVAVGTVCDVAELVGANRAIVKLGLERLRSTNKLGLQIMLKNLSLFERPIKSKDLGFLIGPRLNAVGRVGHPDLGVRMLLSNDPHEAAELVATLEVHNSKRRQMQEEQVALASEMAFELLKQNPGRKSLVLASPEFHLGIVGLIASKLSEQYRLPSCVMTELVDEHELANFSDAKNLWKGSLRTPVGFHLADALQTIRTIDPELLVSGGGHAMAAGVAVRAPQREKFVEFFEQAIASQKNKTVDIVADADFDEAEGVENVLPLLEPFGAGNPAPQFLIKNYEFSRLNVMKAIHLRIEGSVRGRKLSILQFRSPYVSFLQDLSDKRIELDLMGELSENEWNGQKKIEVLLKDLLEVRVSGKRVEIRRDTNEVGDRASAR